MLFLCFCYSALKHTLCVLWRSSYSKDVNQYYVSQHNLLVIYMHTLHFPVPLTPPKVGSCPAVWQGPGVAPGD